ncbi:hypothetical protein IHQ11_18370 [Priestia megaterium]|uniref:hypothetical protein n=1 Tax=Priestia megaterium TaxID=1404 RepID=UPI001B39D936|nr:hypothetical protein [Priestia megaterium]MBQ4868459.1 hypothetical protein [Priestia megaterium]
MMLYDIKHKVYYEVFNTACPKMKDAHQGRSWGYVYKNLNGQPTKFWIDFTHGRFMYFQVEDKWYRVQYLQSNDKKKTADVFKGALIDLILDGMDLKLVRGNFEKRRLLAL